MLGPASASAAKAESKVTIRGWTSSAPPAGEWSGRLKSERAKCHKDRYIELFRRTAKDPVGIGNTVSEKVGEKWIWEVPFNTGVPATAKYFVTVTPTEDCKGDESKIFKFPEDNPPPRPF